MLRALYLPANMAYGVFTESGQHLPIGLNRTLLFLTKQELVEELQACNLRIVPGSGPYLYPIEEIVPAPTW